MNMLATGRRDRRHIPLPEGACAHLERALADLAATPPRSFARRVDRLAVTFRACRRGDDVLPDERVEPQDFRLFALTHRWVERRGRVTGVAVLGIYRAEVDLPGTGRVRFRCDGVMPVGHKAGRPSPDPRTNPTAARAAVLMAQAVGDADHAEMATAVEFPKFSFAFGDRRGPVREPHVTPEAWAAGETRIGDLRAWPAGFFARPAGAFPRSRPADCDLRAGGFGLAEDGSIIRSVQQPDKVYADLSGLGGRPVRNPAWEVLRRYGVVDPDQGYRGWLEATCPRTRGGRRHPATGPATAARRFLADLAARVDADPGLPASLLADLRDACIAAGIPVPADPDEAYDLLAGLVESPWSPAAVPGAAAIQRIRLDGPPGPGTLAFADGVVEADLHDLGSQADRYAQLPGRRVREMFRQRGIIGAGRAGRRRRPHAGLSL